jgi:polysaccharide export outer membrane protein
MAAAPVWSEEENVVLKAWTVVDEGNKEGPSSWSFSDDKVIQSSNIYGGEGVGRDPINPGTYALSGEGGMKDYIFRADVRSSDDDAIGLMFRYLDKDNYYRFSMDRQRRYRTLTKKIKGEFLILAEDDVAYSQNRWYAVKIEAVKDNIKVSIDGSLILDVTDDALNQGKVGLYCWGNAGSEFRNISVTSFKGAGGNAAETPVGATPPAVVIASPAGEKIDVAPVGKDSEDMVPERKNVTVEDPATGIPAEQTSPKVEDVNPGDAYVIGPGDILEVAVWKDDALTKLVTVLPDGKIFYPLIGEISVSGKTVARVKKEMEAKIARFVPDPVLFVVVQQVNSMLVYVIGKVNQPGRFVINSNVNVLQMLAMAGGLNPFAKNDEIKIFRRKGDFTNIFEFNYDEVAAGKNLQQNIQLERGDVIVVP